MSKSAIALALDAICAAMLDMHDWLQDTTDIGRPRRAQLRTKIAAADAAVRGIKANQGARRRR